MALKRSTRRALILAICPATEPVAPAAPEMRTVSPGCGHGHCVSAYMAVGAWRPGPARHGPATGLPTSSRPKYAVRPVMPAAPIRTRGSDTGGLCERFLKKIERACIRKPGEGISTVGARSRTLVRSLAATTAYDCQFSMPCRTHMDRAWSCECVGCNLRSGEEAGRGGGAAAHLHEVANGERGRFGLHDLADGERAHDRAERHRRHCKGTHVVRVSVRRICRSSARTE